VKPAPFAYHRPESVEQALDLLAEHGDDANALAGGQSLIPVLSLRVARPEHIVDINGLSELAHVEQRNGMLELGALVRQRDAIDSPLVEEYSVLLAEALPFVGHPETRNRGTLGGSIAHNDPAAELGAVALASNAVVVLRSKRGERRERVADFLVAPFMTSKAPDELVVQLDFPVGGQGWGWAFEEITRRHHDFAMVAVAVGIKLDESGAIDEARLAFAGAGGTALRAAETESQLRGATPTPALVDDASHNVAGELDPPSDPLASAPYRRHVATILTKRALVSAVERAKGSR
jgi:aerobic carbon-monoxide dehydrogenase medium subunit